MGEAENRIYFHFCHSGFCQRVTVAATTILYFLVVINPAVPLQNISHKNLFCQQGFHFSYLEVAAAVIKAAPGEKIVPIGHFSQLVETYIL